MMVEPEAPRQESETAPEIIDARAAAVTGSPIAAPTQAGAVGVLAHLRLLDSVAAFTHHRDMDALDHSLVLSLAELASASSVSLGKRASDNSSKLESVVHCTPDGHGSYRLQELMPDSDDATWRALRCCMERMEMHAGVTDDDVHRLTVPILFEGRAIGALQLESAAPSIANRPLLDGFARIYANYTALLNESERDKLTGLYNRRTFERHLQRLLQPDVLSARAQAPTTGAQRSPVERVWLAILDIDHFKRINDNYGHIYGDEVILLLAQQMRASFRQDDVLFRFGGEEFVILLGANEESTVHAALERFRQRLQEQVFPQVGHVTVSIGYACIGDHDYPATILDRADKALYFAKENGRNCIHGYESLAAQGLLGQAMTPGSIDLF
jgi:diguanylate cyclase (GGDEF)-like protein